MLYTHYDDHHLSLEEATVLVDYGPGLRAGEISLIRPSTLPAVARAHGIVEPFTNVASLADALSEARVQQYGIRSMQAIEAAANQVFRGADKCVTKLSQRWCFLSPLLHRRSGNRRHFEPIVLFTAARIVDAAGTMCVPALRATVDWCVVAIPISTQLDPNFHFLAVVPQRHQASS